MVKTSTLKLKSKIDLILKNTNFPIKQSYCKELADNLVFEIGENQNSLIAELLHHTCLIKTTPFENFSEYHNDGSRTDKEMSQYQNLDRFLEENLKNIKEYLIGVCSIYYLYVIGETSKGDYLGVSTIYTNT